MLTVGCQPIVVTIIKGSPTTEICLNADCIDAIKKCNNLFQIKKPSTWLGKLALTARRLLRKIMSHNAG